MDVCLPLPLVQGPLPASEPGAAGLGACSVSGCIPQVMRLS